MGLDYYVARFYDPLTGHFTQADSIIPEPGKASAFDRYAYVLNNPIRYSDPSGHGIDSGIGDSGYNRSDDLKRWKDYSLKKNKSYNRNRETNTGYKDLYKWENNLYVNGWSNFDSAWTIYWSPNSSWLQKDGAAIYMEFWISAHVALGAGMGGLACAAIGPACAGVVEGALGIGTAFSADGDPTNELQTINSGTYSVYQYIESGIVKYYGMTKHFEIRAEQHNYSRGWAIEKIPGLFKTLNYYDARAVEQVLIEQAGLPDLYNKINSISRINIIYPEAINRGNEILKLIGLIK